MSEETAIVTVEARPVLSLGSLAISGPDQIVERASAIATALAKVINDRNLYKKISGRNHVYVEGWTTLGAMLGVTPREVSCVRIDDDGTYEAVVELVRVSDQAVIGRGSAICGTDEPTWRDRPNYARRSMATTRATGKAYRLAFSWIMNLAGYEATPAEEMPGDETPEAHWTETQNWKTFYTWTTNTLHLTHDEVHEALEVESVKEFAGSKKQAQSILEAYASEKQQNANELVEETFEDDDSGPISDTWNDLAKERFWQAQAASGVTVNQLYKQVGAKGNGDFFAICTTPAKAYEELAKAASNNESDKQFNESFPKAS